MKEHATTNEYQIDYAFGVFDPHAIPEPAGAYSFVTIKAIENGKLARDIYAGLLPDDRLTRFLARFSPDQWTTSVSLVNRFDLDTSQSFLRVTYTRIPPAPDQTRNYFPIARFSRADLRDLGYDASSLSDEDVERLVFRAGENEALQESYTLALKEECNYRNLPVIEERVIIYREELEEEQPDRGDGLEDEETNE